VPKDKQGLLPPLPMPTEVHESRWKLRFYVKQKPEAVPFSHGRSTTTSVGLSVGYKSAITTGAALWSLDRALDRLTARDATFH